MPTQIINGQPYEQYSPGWYDAQRNAAIQSEGTSGTAGGTGEANYLKALSPTLTGLYSAVNGSTSSGGQQTSTPGTVAYPTSSGGGSSVGGVSSANLFGGDADRTPMAETIAPVDLTAANTAAFATAKDQAANTAAASMSGLRSALQARGMGGAGYEAGQIGQTLGREANTIGQASRDEARNEANLRAEQSIANLNAGVAQRGQTIGAQQADASRRAAAREAAFSGDITQRGQDLSSSNSAAERAAQAAGNAYSGAIAQRGQDIQSAQSAADLAERDAARKSSQTLAILQSVLGGRGGNFSRVPDYVY